MCNHRISVKQFALEILYHVEGAKTCLDRLLFWWSNILCIWNSQ